jgi:EAL domain-containing protein (putative c-di-GMP-specific phosphodiesterase class I)/GGDEF domain-containing protein
MRSLLSTFAAWPGLRKIQPKITSINGLMKRLEQDIAQQTPSAVVALCIITLSRSDRMEAALGLPQCRQVEEELIQRVVSALPDHDYMALLSPNEIWVVLPRLPTAVMASLAASNLVGALEPPVTSTDTVVTLRPTVGIALAARAGSTPLTMLKAAENAKHHARSVGHRFWVDVTNERNYLLDTEIAAQLQRALNHNGLGVFYQPKVDLGSGKILGIEALIRWSGTQHLAITPSSLVDAAEQYGMMPELTRFVLNTALREYVSLLSSVEVGRIWVNLSASMLHDAKLPALLMQLTKVWGVNPQVLGLELTESTLLTDVEKSIATLNALVSYGFSLAIDDFGTGYSSLAYLRRLPLSELKIDQLFVRNMGASLADKQIVRTIIDLAHNFQLAVVAEGAEHDQALAMLKEMGCDQVQGHVFTKALAASELVKWVHQHNAARGSVGTAGKEPHNVEFDKIEKTMDHGE